MTIYYESGDIKRFDNYKKYSSYCRAVPGIAQSGSTKRRGRGSKQGNAYLKHAFSQAAVAAVRNYKYLKNYFDGQMCRHKGAYGKMVCYNIIAHKLACAVFYVLQGKEFDSKRLFNAA